MAPVVDLKWHAPNNKSVHHVVVRGETLYAIAFRYDMDYRNLASINHLNSPYVLYVGQNLRLKGAGSQFKSRKSLVTRRNKPVYKNSPKSLPSAPSFNGRWIWPSHGKVVSHFYPARGKKGIDIAAHKGEKIHAASAGVVAYAGNGLTGYGNLIIIKHNKQYLTAYGNNSRNLVREGESVKSGQIIAEMGVVDRRFWGLHFEIRKSGKPVNPLNFLPKA